MPDLSIQNKGKQAAGYAAADLIQDGMVIGLGTGSTVAFFLERLIQHCNNGLKISGIATSRQTAEIAKKGGIPLLNDQDILSVDLTIDGADEIDHSKQMIKGGGGALLREKITAHMAKKTIIIVDEKKYVKKLGAFPLPVEIAPFCFKATIQHLRNLEFNPQIRMHLNQIFITDNGNYIADIHLKNFIEDAVKLDQLLNNIPGILETGLFLNVAHTVIIGHSNGTVTYLR